MHWIQRNIILALLRRATVFIKDIKPQGVPDNLFNYHMVQLIKSGYVTRSGRGVYALTEDGQAFAGSFSTSTNRQVENIKTVVMLTSVNAEGGQLLFKWNRQPYLGYLTLPHDRMVVGKKLADAISDSLVNKCGADSNTPVDFLRSGFVTIRHNQKIISHMYALVYEVDGSVLELPFHGKNGTAIWVKTTTKPETKIMSGISDLLRAISYKKSEPFEVVLSY